MQIKQQNNGISERGSYFVEDIESQVHLEDIWFYRNRRSFIPYFRVCIYDFNVFHNINISLNINIAKNNRYMENGSLACVLDKFGPLPESLVVSYVHQVFAFFIISSTSM